MAPLTYSHVGLHMFAVGFGTLLLGYWSMTSRTMNAGACRLRTLRPISCWCHCCRQRRTGGCCTCFVRTWRRPSSWTTCLTRRSVSLCSTQCTGCLPWWASSMGYTRMRRFSMPPTVSCGTRRDLYPSDHCTLPNPPHWERINALETCQKMYPFLTFN